MKSNLGTIIMAIAVILGGMIGKAAMNKFFEVREETKIEEGLDQAAKEINKSCPKQIDEDTRIDKAIHGPGKKFAYYYTLTRYSSKDISKEAFDSEIAPAIKKNALGGDGIKTMLKKGILVEYHYAGKDGGKISMIKLKPSDL
jgi:hypothetical protein